MIPSNELRFVERETPRRYPHDSQTIVVRILQQWCRGDSYHGSNSSTGLNGEWRDVPIVKEIKGEQL